MRLSFYFTMILMSLFLKMNIIFIIFIGVISFVEQYRMYGRKLKVSEVFELTMFNTPTEIYRILPLVMIFTSIWYFISLAKKSELVIVRASGKSIVSLLLVPVVCILLIGTMLVLFSSPLVSKSETRYSELKNYYIGSKSTDLSFRSGTIWLRDFDDYHKIVISTERVRQNGTILEDVDFTYLLPNSKPTMRVRAERAELNEQEWSLQNVTRWNIESGVDPNLTVRKLPTFSIPTNLNEQKIKDSLESPTFKSIWAYSKNLRQIENSGFSTASYRMWFHSEMASPLLLVGMFLIGGIFTMRYNRSGNNASLAVITIVIGFVFFFIKTLAAILGENGDIPIHFAAYAPPIASILLAIGVIFHYEEG